MELIGEDTNWVLAGAFWSSKLVLSIEKESTAWMYKHKLKLKHKLMLNLNMKL